MGFPGCIGCIDCTDLAWKNCALEKKGQHHNPKDGKLATIKVEGWCDMDLYMWHWFVGRPGTTNDKTMMRFSPLFIYIFNHTYDMNLPVPYRIHDNAVLRTLAYLLADGIYPRFPILVLPAHQADEINEIVYTKRQEGRRKDIERGFGVIKARFKILPYEDFRWDKEEILMTTKVCCILHNLLVRMNQEGHFVEDLEAEGDDFNIILEMLAREQEELYMREHEREQRDHDLHNEMVGLEGTELVEEMFLREAELSSEEMHQAVKRELREKFATERVAQASSEQDE